MGQGHRQRPGEEEKTHDQLVARTGLQLEASLWNLLGRNGSGVQLYAGNLTDGHGTCELRGASAQTRE